MISQLSHSFETCYEVTKDMKDKNQIRQNYLLFFVKENQLFLCWTPYILNIMSFIYLLIFYISFHYFFAYSEAVESDLIFPDLTFLIQLCHLLSSFYLCSRKSICSDEWIYTILYCSNTLYLYGPKLL